MDVGEFRAEGVLTRISGAVFQTIYSVRLYKKLRWRREQRSLHAASTGLASLGGTLECKALGSSSAFWRVDSAQGLGCTKV